MAPFLKSLRTAAEAAARNSGSFPCSPFTSPATCHATHSLSVSADLRTYGPHVLKRQSAVDAAFSVSAYFMTFVYHMCHILRYGRGAVKTCCLHGQYRRIFEERPTRCHIASLPPLTHIRCCRHSQPSSTLTPRAPCYILPLVTFPALCCRSLACRARTASAVSAYFRTYATSAPLKRS